MVTKSVNLGFIAHVDGDAGGHESNTINRFRHNSYI